MASASDALRWSRAVLVPLALRRACRPALSGGCYAPALLEGVASSGLVSLRKERKVTSGSVRLT